MNPLIKRLALALLLASVAVVSATPVGAAGRDQSTTTPLAGPWYTPRELKALIAYSNASLVRKKAMLAEKPVAVQIVQRPGGFDWGDAGIGGAATLALVLLVAGGAALRHDSRRQEAHG